MYLSWKHANESLVTDNTFKALTFVRMYFLELCNGKSCMNYLDFIEKKMKYQHLKWISGKTMVFSLNWYFSKFIILTGLTDGKTFVYFSQSLKIQINYIWSRTDPALTVPCCLTRRSATFYQHRQSCVETSSMTCDHEQSLARWACVHLNRWSYSMLFRILIFAPQSQSSQRTF